ncbi:MAG: hypothetical protein AB7L17_16730 [Ilumatobacteraceae bacterium]
MISAFEPDLATVVLGLGVLALAVTATMMLLEYLPGSRDDARTGRRPPPRALSAGAAQAVAEARARAAAASEVLGLPAPVAGQIVDVTDGRWTDRSLSVDEASAIAVHFAENDPQRVAEVISQWIRSDSKDGEGAEPPPATMHRSRSATASRANLHGPRSGSSHRD